MEKSFNLDEAIEKPGLALCCFARGGEKAEKSAARKKLELKIIGAEDKVKKNHYPKTLKKGKPHCSGNQMIV